MRRELAVPTSGSCRKDRTDVPEPSVGNETAEVCAAGVQQLKIILKQQVKQKRTDETKDQQFWGRNASNGGRKCKAAIRQSGGGHHCKASSEADRLRNRVSIWFHLVGPCRRGYEHCSSDEKRDLGLCNEPLRCSITPVIQGNVTCDLVDVACRMPGFLSE